MKIDQLDNIIENKPHKAGVYIFREGDNPIYIGKAVDIKERLASYRDPRNSRIRKMVENADKVDHRVTGDEKEALLLEANLIKEYKPKYNTRLKDSKSYPVVQFEKDNFPTIEATRDPKEEATVYGPYTSMKKVQNSIKSVRDIYGIASPRCRRKESEGDPCMDYELGLCSAPFAEKINAEKYMENVRKAESVFKDSPDDLINLIESRMRENSQENNFERAATLRDYIESLKGLGGDKDFSEESLSHVIAVNGALDRIGLLVMEDSTIQSKDFHRLSNEARSKEHGLEIFISQFYASDSLPGRIITEKKLKNKEVIEWLEDNGVDCSKPKTGRERILLDSAKKVARKPQDTKMKTLEDELGIKVDRIECFDVSHTGGDDVVGSNVVFESDEPVKSDYRKKKLTEENNDYENMYKLIKWRAERFVEGRDSRPEPDLLLIDGGKQQLNAAARALRNSDWSISVLGIVKPDDEIIGLHKNPELNDSGNQILSEIRDEAHRFAKSYHESKRDKINPILEKIDGLGEKRRAKLMNRFTLEEMKDSSAEDLTNVEGIGPEIANKIKKYLDNGS